MFFACQYTIAFGGALVDFIPTPSDKSKPYVIQLMILILKRVIPTLYFYSIM